MKYACSEWRNTSENVKEAWRNRAEDLNSSEVPGKFTSVPAVICCQGKGGLSKLIMEALTVEWENCILLYGRQFYMIGGGYRGKNKKPCLQFVLVKRV